MKDIKGNPIFKNEEYFVVEIEHGFVVVHCEAIQNYCYERFEDSRLLTEDYEELKQVLHDSYGIYPETF